MYIRKKVKTEEEKEKNREEREKMLSLFMQIWKERPHFSELSGKWLGKELLSTFCDHLLEKSVYPQFKYEKENIILITADEHDAKTRGFPSKAHLERIEKAKQKFLYGKCNKEKENKEMD